MKPPEIAYNNRSIKAIENLSPLESHVVENKEISVGSVKKEDPSIEVEVRSSLDKAFEKGETRRKGWKALISRPTEERVLPLTDHPFDRLKAWFKSFSRKERQQKKTSQENQKQFIEAVKKYPMNVFNYVKGKGVEGRVGTNVGIQANGFHECSGLVLQTPTGVSVVHISPNAIRDPEDGGEIVKDRDIYAHIRSALRGLLYGTESDSTDSKADLTQKEIDALQEMADSGTLKSTMYLGETQYVLNVLLDLASFAQSKHLPYIKTEAFYVGDQVGSGYSIYATPTEAYVIGENNRVIKKGADPLPQVVRYEEI